ncbi:MAG TPA: SGNH/GDSL hydrolase family protein [Chitinophagaceae bacterium]|nr:SGNH/GDSL hydrolase family protein [Chitinophagaceae bacterium]
MKKYFIFIALCFPAPAFVMGQLSDTSVHTVLFLGNSITYAGNYVIDIEACYTLWHTQQKIDFINLGLPSETVSGLSEDGHAGGRFPRPDLHERLHRILKEIKPDLIFACYGMNDGIYLPFDEDRFQKYKEGINWLHDTLVKTGARVIMLTPPVYDELRGSAKGYANVLDKYADWILHQRKTAKWEVADIHYSMKKYLEAHRKLDASFGIDGFALANDGVHPGEAGHWLMAKQLLIYLGEKDIVKYPDIKTAMASHPHGEEILKLVTERQNFMKDAWLTATGHTRPEMKTGLPLNEAKSKASAIGKQINALK